MDFWKATLIRCIRTFLTTILGVWTAGELITNVDWEAALMMAFSSTVYIFLLCLLAGLPEAPDEEEEEEEGAEDY